MARRLAVWLMAVSLVSAAGCRSRSDLVEAELRTRDRQLRELQGELAGTQTMNQALENTLRDQRPGQPNCRPGSSPGGQIKDIQLGRGTGGIDEDKVPGDEGIQVVLIPRDVDGSPIKAPGTLKVTALEITPEGVKVPLSAWDVSALKLRLSWRSGLLSTGYHVNLGWQIMPRMDKLRIVAQFFPLEGGVYEAEKDVTIRLGQIGAPGCPAPAGAQPWPVSPELPVGPPPRSNIPMLPPPEQLQPPKQPAIPDLPVSRRVPNVQLLLPIPADPAPR